MKKQSGVNLKTKRTNTRITSWLWKGTAQDWSLSDAVDVGETEVRSFAGGEAGKGES